MRHAARVLVAVLALLALTGAAAGSLKTINVKEIVPGVPGWAVAGAVAFGVVVGGGFMAAQGAVRSRAASRALGDAGHVHDPGAPRSASVQRALGAETGAFVADETLYKSALLKRLGATGPPVPATGGARARYAPCGHCTMPMRFAPGETSARCVKCGRTSSLPDVEEDDD